MKFKFRSKFNHGYLQSFVWKALYDFNPIEDGPFFSGLLMDWGGTKRAPSLKYVLHILQWWHLAQLYLTQKRSKKYINHVQGIIQAAFEISNQFWAHQNLHPNFDELAKNKNTKPPCRDYSASRTPSAFYNIQTLNLWLKTGISKTAWINAWTRYEILL